MEREIDERVGARRRGNSDAVAAARDPTETPQETATVDREVIKRQAAAEVASRRRGIDSRGESASDVADKQAARAAKRHERTERPERPKPPAETEAQRLAREAAAAEAARIAAEKAAAKKAAADKAAAEQAERDRVAAERAKRTEGYEKGLSASLGGSAAEAMELGRAAASKGAAETADVTSTQAIRKAIQAARTAGVNKGQSALMGSQIAGDTYTGTYQGQLESGQNRYQQATSQFQTAAQGAQNADSQRQQLTLQAQQLELEAQRLAAEGKAAEAAAKTEKAKSIWNIIGSIAGAAATIFMSDEKFKENIKVDTSLDSILTKLKGKPSSSITLDSILGKIRPVSYNYKGENKKQLGITAQDLEKTPLAGSVINTPEGKVVDAGQLEGANLALIIELAGMVRDLQRGGKK